MPQELHCDRCGEPVPENDGAEIVDKDGIVLFVHASTCIKEGEEIA